MKSVILALTLVFLLNPAAADSLDGREGNGGDEVSLEFNSFLQSARVWMSKESLSIPEFGSPDAIRVLKSDALKVLISEQPLYVDSDGKTVEVTAKNIRNPDQIIINRLRWKSLNSDVLKLGLAVHELLGLAGLESTGDYSYTTKFFAEFGISCVNGVCFGDKAIDASGIAKLKASLIGRIWQKSFQNSGITVVETFEFRERTIVVSAICKWSEKGRSDIFVRLESEINYLENSIQYLQAKSTNQESASGDNCFVFTKQWTVPVLNISDRKINIGGEEFSIP